MIYYGIRILLLLVIIPCLVIFLRKKVFSKEKKIIVSNTLVKNRNKIDKRFRRKNIFLRVRTIIIALLIVYLIYLPYEGLFARFKSLDSAMLYSIPDKLFSEQKAINGGDTVFIISRNGSHMNFHSTVVYENGYGLCDFRSVVRVGRSKVINNDEFSGTVSLSTIYSKITDKTFYFINAISMSSKVNEISSEQDETFTMLDDSAEYSSCFYLISSGKPKNNLTVILNGTKVIL